MAITGLGDSPFKSTWVKSNNLRKYMGFGGNNSDLSTAMSDWFFAAAAATTTFKMWNGASWITRTAQIWNGASWVTKTVYRWNGVSWISTT